MTFRPMLPLGLASAALVLAGCGAVATTQSTSPSLSAAQVPACTWAKDDHLSSGSVMEIDSWIVSPKGSIDAGAISASSKVDPNPPKYLEVTSFSGQASRPGQPPLRISRDNLELAAKLNQSSAVAIGEYFVSPTDSVALFYTIGVFGADGQLHTAPQCDTGPSMAKQLKRNPGSTAEEVITTASKEGAHSPSWARFLAAGTGLDPRNGATPPTTQPWSERASSGRSLQDPDAPNSLKASAANLDVVLEVPASWTENRNSMLCFRTETANGACTPLSAARQAREMGQRDSVVRLVGLAVRGEPVTLYLSDLTVRADAPVLAELGTLPAEDVGKGEPIELKVADAWQKELPSATVTGDRVVVLR